MNNDLISIIVPVYKVEKYLERCVNSILKQSYANLEIILVNDGSPDNSGKLAEELAKKDRRIVVYHKKNGGLSDARNYGVERARGTYIGFVDGDDYINEDMYNHLYQTIITEKSDIVECNVTRIYGNSQRPNYEGKDYVETIASKEYLKEYLTMERVYGSVWCKLIRADIAKEVKFRVGKYYEDIFYNYDLIEKINKITITSKPYYYYYIRENSITTEKYSPKQLDLVEIVEKLDEYVNKNYPEYREESFIRLTYAYLSTFNHIVVEDKYKEYQEFSRIYEFLKNNKSRVLSSKKAGIALKGAIAIININISLYRFLFKKYKKRRKLNS